ncbi:MAG: hypothetical protein LBT89_01105 [Planctomycetaceae bacterium]|jgi:Arc/MetJ-type ribon-helix-helix transcriptional regulator|nr:hypothetical protein [Planctomycetaceae bacterium]
MSTISVTLSEPLQNFVMRQVTELGLADSDEYIEKLVQEQQQRKIDEYHWELVQEAIEEDAWLTEEEFWEQIKESTRKRREARKSGVAV